RGGIKLAHALDVFRIDAAGRHALDIGASTGGFTDVLLQRGAQSVVALDVGHGQLDWRLRNDPRVVVREGINARALTRSEVPQSVDLVTIDVSFISLRHIFPPFVVSRVGIVAKSHLREAAPHLVDIASWLEARGIVAVFETATAGLMAPAAKRRVADKRALVDEVDMVLVLGGDGTLLGMADRIGEARSSIAILGVNFGSLGFLTEVTLPELYPSLEAALSGRAHIEDRLMLRATTIRGGNTLAEHIALNDVVVT